MAALEDVKELRRDLIWSNIGECGAKVMGSSVMAFAKTGRANEYRG